MAANWIIAVAVLDQSSINYINHVLLINGLMATSQPSIKKRHT